MRIAVEVDDEIAALIDEMAKISGLSRTEVVENTLRKVLAEDRKLIKSQRLEEKIEV